MTQIREILVRAHNWVGDVVMATPGFRTLRSGFPDARITLHIRPGLEPLVAGAPWFDAVIPVTSHRRGLRALVREGRGLRRTKRFDLGICLPDSFASALLMRVAGVREIVGYRRGGRGPLLNRAVDPPRDAGRAAWIAREHHVLGLVAALGCEASDVRLELFVTGEEEAAARKLLAQHGVGPESPLAVLAPGASYGPSKLWPAPSFARVGDALAQTGATVLVVGSPAETPVARRVVESSGRPRSSSRASSRSGHSRPSSGAPAFWCATTRARATWRWRSVCPAWWSWARLASTKRIRTWTAFGCCSRTWIAGPAICASVRSITAA